MKNIEIGSYEAKTILPELLRKVQQGQRFTITNRGEPVAELVPVDAATSERVRRAAADMRAFMATSGEDAGRFVDGDRIREWIEEGRR